MRASAVCVTLGLLIGAPGARAEPGEVVEVLAKASGVPGGLTSDQVAASVRATSPSLAVRTAELAAASATVAQARSAYLPHLSLTARYRRLSSIQPAPFGNIVIATGAPAGVLAPDAALTNTPLAFPVLLNETTFDVQLVVPISDDLLRIARGVAAARRSEDAARFSEDAERRNAIAEARVAYYAWARARLSAVVAADAVRQTELHLADVQQRAAADRASRADVLAVEAQRAAAVQLHVRADGLARVAEAQVRIALRIDAAPELAIGEDLAHDLTLAEPGSEDALLTDAIAHRPELRAAGAAAEALVEQAQAAVDSALPRLDLIADLTSADPNLRYVPAEDTFHTTWAIGAQLTWTVSDVPGELARARGLRAQAAAARAQRTVLVDALRGEVAEAVAAIRDASSAQLTTAHGLVSAEEAYRVRRELFREGAATSTELSDAETALTRARLDAVAARIDARVAAVRLAHAVGRDGVH